MDGQEQQTTPVQKSQTGPIIAIVGLIVIVVVGVLAFQNMNKSQTQTQNTTTAQQQTQQQPAQTNEQMVAEPTTAAVSPQAGAYKDGTYTAVGNYTSPGGAEQLGVTLTISGGVITSSEIEVKATRPISKTRQTDFKDNYKPQVEGKNIDEIVLTKVSGSSLSPKGFNDAVEQIKQQAQQS